MDDARDLSWQEIAQIIREDELFTEEERGNLLRDLTPRADLN